MNPKSIFSRVWSGALMARTQVYLARRKGDLVAPDTLNCVDCGVTARDYDHRDYNKPLDVEPVCRLCNLKRGKAIPKAWSKSDAITYAKRLFSNEGWRRIDRQRAFVIELCEASSGLVTPEDVAPELFAELSAAD